MERLQENGGDVMDDKPAEDRTQRKEDSSFSAVVSAGMIFNTTSSGQRFPLGFPLLRCDGVFRYDLADSDRRVVG